MAFCCFYRNGLRKLLQTTCCSCLCRRAYFNRVIPFKHNSEMMRSLLTAQISKGNYDGCNSHFKTCFIVKVICTVLGLSIVFNQKKVNCEGVRSHHKQILHSPSGYVITEKFKKKLTVKAAIRECHELLIERLNEAGAPGLSVAVSVDGRTVWTEGIGYADVENKVSCKPDTVMRIASISKPITMTAVAKLWEDGKLDLDVPVQKYVPDFPKKFVDNEEVTITTRHLLTHCSGIRHYSLKSPKDDSKEKEGDKLEEPVKDPLKTKGSTEGRTSAKHDKLVYLKDIINKKLFKDEEPEEDKTEFELKEYLIKEHFNTVKESLEMFINDDLFFKPGTDYLYSTHAFTLVSAVVEGASGQSFKQVLNKLFHDLGLENTYLDQPDRIIYNRASYYCRNKHKKLRNVPYVDNSYKWAGGGLLSTVEDLLKFGNIMLYSLQTFEETGKGLPGYLKPSSVAEMWRPFQNSKYGLGWIVSEEKSHYGCARRDRFHASHTGGAVGASSVLFVLPLDRATLRRFDDDPKRPDPPCGVVVSILCNMQGIGFSKTALRIAELFEKVQW